MVKKILLSVCFFWISLVQGTTVKLTLENLEKHVDQHGKLIPTAYIGDTITVQVTVSEADRDTGTVQLDGLDQFDTIGNAQSHNKFSDISDANDILTAKKTVTYQIQANQAGTFILGPAHVALKGGQKTSSQPIIFKILDETPGDPTSSKTIVDDDEEILEHEESEHRDLFYRVKLKESDIVVGQPVEIKVAVYSRGPIVNYNVASPKFDGFDVKETKQFIRKQATVHGVPYDVREISFILTPREEGIKKIAPFRVNYLVQKKRQKKSRQHGFFGEIFSMINQVFVTRETAKTNPFSLTINPLPPSQERVDGVGTFTSFSAKVDKQNLMVNEPFMLTLEIEGKGNLDQIPDLQLTLPETMKFYSSKINLQEDLSQEYRGGKKIFEYVVQVTKPGATTIPAQKFIVFDVEKKSYVTMQTSPIELNIKPGQQTSQESFAPLPLDKEEKEIELPKGQKDIHFIEEDAVIRKASASKIPWWLFLVFIIIPLLLFKKSILLDIKNYFFGRWLSGQSHKKTLILFETQLNTLVQKGDTQKLYHFFIKFLATKFNKEPNEVSEQWIEQTLHTQQWDHDKIVSFLDYLNECASIHFVAHEKQKNEHQALLKKATYWFLILNK